MFTQLGQKSSDVTGAHMWASQQSSATLQKASPWKGEVAKSTQGTHCCWCLLNKRLLRRTCREDRATLTLSHMCPRNYTCLAECTFLLHTQQCLPQLCRFKRITSHPSDLLPGPNHSASEFTPEKDQIQKCASYRQDRGAAPVL